MTSGNPAGTARETALPYSPLNRLLETLERLTKYAVVLAVFGYMSLRSHFNHLGISATSPLGFERYLMETYLLFFGAALRLVQLGVWALVLGLPVWATGLLLFRRPRRKEHALVVAARIGSWLVATPAALLMSLGFLLGVFLCLRSLGTHLDVVVGPLCVSTLDRSAWRFDLALLVCMASGLLAPMIRRGLAKAAQKELSHASRLWALSGSGLIALVILRNVSMTLRRQGWAY